ncbi:hypothetical protein S83_067897 [Arachis hypogaea]
MRNGLIWATAEDLTKNRGQSPITTQILQSLNSQKLPLTFAASLAKKAEVGAMFWVGLYERSLHNIADLMMPQSTLFPFSRKASFLLAHHLIIYFFFFSNLFVMHLFLCKIVGN